MPSAFVPASPKTRAPPPPIPGCWATHGGRMCGRVGDKHAAGSTCPGVRGQLKSPGLQKQSMQVPSSAAWHGWPGALRQKAGRRRQRPPPACASCSSFLVTRLAVRQRAERLCAAAPAGRRGSGRTLQPAWSDTLTLPPPCCADVCNRPRWALVWLSHDGACGCCLPCNCTQGCWCKGERCASRLWAPRRHVGFPFFWFEAVGRL